MTNNAELLPCPICARSIHVKVRDCSRNRQGVSTLQWSVSCDGCCLDLFAPSEQEAVKRWNTRLLLQPQAVPDEGKVWLLMRHVLEHGAAIRQDYDAGNHKSYEEYSARIDEAARVRTEQFMILASAAPQPAPDVEARPHKKEFMRNAEGRIAYGWSKQDEEGGFHVEAWAPDWMTVTYLAQGWFLPYEKVNELQANSIAKTIDTAKAAHHTDLSIRINGEYRRFEADWVKHLVYVHPLQQLSTPPASVSEDKP